MASYNKVILLGNLTRDPQLSYLPSQTAVVDFGLATNRKWTDQSGAAREDVCFVDCQMFGKRAEVINKYLHKGDPLFAEGRLKFDSWQAQDGTKRSKLRVFVENFEFISSGRKNNSGQDDRQPSAPVGQEENIDMSAGSSDDDIPF